MDSSEAQISARPLRGASRANWGSHSCASELMLKNKSKTYQNNCRFSHLEAWVPNGTNRRISTESPWKSVESPSNLH